MLLLMLIALIIASDKSWLWEAQQAGHHNQQPYMDLIKLVCIHIDLHPVSTLPLQLDSLEQNHVQVVDQNPSFTFQNFNDKNNNKKTKQKKLKPLM